MEEKYKRYNRDLVNRFISDYKLPIAVNKEKYFFYFLELYEKDFKSLTKWMLLWDMIDERYGGDAILFLNEYYNLRDEIIVSTENSDAYVKFNNMDMGKFKVDNKPQVTSNNVYNGENINKVFLSIDLKKANFQALRFVNPDIVLDANTYEDFIGKFTDLEYVKESKYTRQVIFGKLNPKRHITVEKYLINEVWKAYEQNFSDKKIVSMANDEIVIESSYDYVPDACDFYEDICDRIEEVIFNNTGLKVKAQYYFLKGYQMYCLESGNPRNTFYVRENLADGSKTFVCVPAPYHALTYKIYNNIPLCDEDYHFIYEGIDCIFNEKFGIKDFVPTNEKKKGGHSCTKKDE